MTLRIGQVGGAGQVPSAAITARTGPSRSVPEAGPRAVRLDPPVVGSFARPGGNADETSLARREISAVVWQVKKSLAAPMNRCG